MTQTTVNPTTCRAAEGLAPIEDRNAVLERALIADFLKPHEARWPTMTPDEQKRLLTQASTHASLKMAAAHSCCGLLLGFIALLHAASGGLH